MSNRPRHPSRTAHKFHYVCNISLIVIILGKESVIKQASQVWGRWGPWPSPPPPHTCEISHLQLLPLHPIQPPQMHVYLIDKFSLYNLKMDNICGRNM